MMHKVLHRQLKDRIRPELCNFKIVLLFIVGLEKIKPIMCKKKETFYLKEKIKEKNTIFLLYNFLGFFFIIPLSPFLYMLPIKTHDCSMSVHRPVSAQWNGLCYGAFSHKK